MKGDNDKSIDLVDVEVTSFSYKHIPGEVNVEDYVFSAEICFQENPESNLIRTITEAKFFPDVESGEVEVDSGTVPLAEYPLASILNTVVFDPGPDVFEGSEEEGEIREEYASIMAQVSFDTLRGVLAEKLRGTHLDNKPLPIINASGHIQKIQEEE
jgi:hypothetical protein